MGVIVGVGDGSVDLSSDGEPGVLPVLSVTEVGMGVIVVVGDGSVDFSSDGKLKVLPVLSVTEVGMAAIVAVRGPSSPSLHASSRKITIMHTCLVRLKEQIRLAKNSP